jgi:ABC-type lipoprotein release transport system permease subunit
VFIIWTQGIYNGMNSQVITTMIDTEYGGGQYWNENYDPYDPLSLQDAHAKLPVNLQKMIREKQATPILITQGTAYPNGRMKTILLKGIDPEQDIINLPSHFLVNEDEELPALIGTRMAESSNLSIGDYLTIRWRDKNGMFDAVDVRIIQIMKTTVQSVDAGQIWLPLEKLRQMTKMENEATLVTVGKDVMEPESVAGWDFKTHGYLLKDIQEMVKSKTAGASIMYAMLLFLAMLAIFNTQVLSIFRRRKEMGTLMALGMTRVRVIELFTTEGAMQGALAAVVAAIYGLPMLIFFAKKGIGLPQSTDEYGFAIGEKIFPMYSAGLIIGTTVFILIVTTIVSYLPTRRIAKLKPTDALRGKLS